MRPRSIPRVVSGLLLLATALFCAQTGVRTALAEYDSGRGNAQAASRWRPDVADYYRQRAGEAPAGDYALGLIQHAVALNPLDAENWILQATLTYRTAGASASRAVLQRGLAAVGGFDLRLQAAALARIDGDEEGFWQELTAALVPLRQASMHPELLQQRLQRVLDLVGPLSGAGAARLATAMRPCGPAVNLAAVRLLLSQGDLAAAAALWTDHRCPPWLVSDCGNTAVALVQEELSAAGASASEAVRWGTRASAVWNEAIATGLIAQSPVASGRITDGAFRHAWLGAGFSWQDDGEVPLVVQRPAAQAVVDVALDGYHNGPLRLFHQWIQLQPGRSYRLEYSASFSTEAAGFQWEIQSPAGETLTWAPLLTPTTLQQATVILTAPQRAGPFLLAATYQRPLGNLPAHGHLRVAALDLIEAATK